jgi:hypothetical protein
MSEIYLIELHAVIIMLCVVTVSCIYVQQTTSDKGDKNVQS